MKRKAIPANPMASTAWSDAQHATWEYVKDHPEGVSTNDLVKAFGWERGLAKTRLEGLYVQRFTYRVLGERHKGAPTLYYPEASPPDPPTASAPGPKPAPRRWSGPIVNADPQKAAQGSVSRADGSRDAGDGKGASTAPSVDPPPSAAAHPWQATADHVTPEQRQAVSTVSPEPVFDAVPIAAAREHDGRCKIEGCQEPERSARGYCEAHERRYGPIAW